MFKSELFNPLEVALHRALRTLNNHETGSEEYTKALDAVTKLHKMKEDEKPSSVSKDTLLIVGANLLGIIMIISHERLNVITTKAFGMQIRPKI